MKYRCLRRLIAKIEATLDPHLCMLKLNSGQVVFMSWEQFRDGLNDVTSGRDTHEAYVVRNTVATDNEYCARNLALLRAVMNPIDTDDPEAVRRYQASKLREAMSGTVRKDLTRAGLLQL